MGTSGVNEPGAVTPAAASDWLNEVTDLANDHEYKVNNDLRLDYTAQPTRQFIGQNDDWGTPRPDRYSWPPIVVWDMHFQLFAGATPIPASITAWINQLSRRTFAEMGLNSEYLASNYFAQEDSGKPLGLAYTTVIEEIMANSFGHISVKRIDKFYGVTPGSGGFAPGGTVSAGISTIVPEFQYEMIAKITDKRPDWYPNISSMYELTPWWKRAHMFEGSHFDSVANNFKTSIEALGYKCRIYFDEEIIWTRRPSRHDPNGGADWPYAAGQGSTTTYAGHSGSTRSYDSPGLNPIPENDTGVNRYEFNE